ncbi:hypothetical protein NDU88_011512 [Pleurodeles waltl]|uniref:Uncharacterized protein n=1 Tax=Pleurodeles waltl TaxID=8319 RepID=A0AAV7QXG9_PLEWA|nr:hypothetical protein NDU88_011512 [Pleurodeles waltl]
MGTPSDATGSEFRTEEPKEKTDFAGRGREMNPEESEVERPLDAEEEEFSEPIRTPEKNEAVSLEARETTTQGARHGPGGSWLLKDQTSAESRGRTKDKTIDSDQKNPQDV